MLLKVIFLNDLSQQGNTRIRASTTCWSQPTTRLCLKHTSWTWTQRSCRAVLLGHSPSSPGSAATMQSWSGEDCRWADPHHQTMPPARLPLRGAAGVPQPPPSTEQTNRGEWQGWNPPICLTPRSVMTTTTGWIVTTRPAVRSVRSQTAV